MLHNLKIIKFIVQLVLLPLLLMLYSCGKGHDGKRTFKASGRTVEVVGSDGNYTLYRHGKPYFIKGAAGYDHFGKVKAYGGNSIRVWHTDDAGRILDEAHANGLTVTLGIWVGREKEGFNYYDKEEVARQKEEIRKTVLKYKDHPALLLWGIGNELYAESHNVKVWNAVNEIAEMIHELDPNHPTTTTVMNVPEKVINLISKRCPALDILSINSFGAMHTLKEDLARSSWQGPYIVSEFGARGYWEAYMTEWLAPIEQTSSEKAEFSKERYQKAVLADSARCLGSYVFIWGHKQETTPTWFSLFGKHGHETQLIHEMQQLWTGQPIKNQAPYVAYLTLADKHAADNVYLAPGQEATASVYAYDPEGKELTMHWEVLPETKSEDGNSAKEKTPPAIKNVIQATSGSKATIKAPDKSGAYRLYVYLYDGDGNVATANIPFYVKK